MKKLLPIILASFFFMGRAVAQSAWKSADRGPFIEECVKAAGEGMSQDSAKYYCYCMLEKVEAAYPDPIEAGKLTADNFNSPEWKKIIAGCLGGYWKLHERKEFMSSCIDAAKASIGEEKANSYCECMMFKIENRYHSYTEASKITTETLSSPVWKKIIQSCLE